ncbi:MAG: lectin-like protein, partial [Gammaproteobacteria bacterium]
MGSEVVANQISEDAFAPSVAVLANGSYVVAWQARDGLKDARIYAQLFAADGSRLGTEAIVESANAEISQGVRALATPDGGYLLAWQSLGVDPGGYNIYLRRYDSSGQALGEQQLVNRSLDLNQFVPKLTLLSDGTVAIAYLTQIPGEGRSVYFQRMSLTGAYLGPETRVSDTGDTPTLAIASLSDGGFVISWGSLGPDGNFNTYVQEYTAQGTRIQISGRDGADNIAWSGAEPVYLAGNAGEDAVSGGTGADHLDGGAGNDVLSGHEGDDTLFGSAGNDTLLGGLGDDTAMFSGNASQYLLTRVDHQITVNGPEGLDVLTDVERLQFANAVLAASALDSEATGTLAVTGTAAEGGTLTADVLNATDLDGSVSISFQWQSTDIEPFELPGIKTWSENGHEYALIESIGLSWDEARSLAIGLGEGWDLVTVTSQTEHEFLVRNVLPVDALNRTHYWIGFTDAVTEGQFVWVSGETSSFSLWHPGEPNNVGEDHAAYDYRAGWGWNDAAVQTTVPTQLRGFVVERSRWSNLSSGSSLSIPSDESLVGKTVRVV